MENPDNISDIDVQYREILRCDLGNELLRRNRTVDIGIIETYSIKELEDRLSKLVDW